MVTLTAGVNGQEAAGQARVMRPERARDEWAKNGTN